MAIQSASILREETQVILAETYLSIAASPLVYLVVHYRPHE